MGHKLLQHYESIINKMVDHEFSSNLKDIIIQSPDYITEVPSSSTGKYHPNDEFCKQGMIYHIDRCLVFAEEIIEMWDIEDGDILYAGCILHDVFKSGETYTKKTDPKHALYIYQHILDYIKYRNLGKLMRTKLEKLAVICALHEGKWTIDDVHNKLREDGIIWINYSKLIEAMHIVDYFASRRSVYQIMQKRGFWYKWRS